MANCEITAVYACISHQPPPHEPECLMSKSQYFGWLKTHRPHVLILPSGIVTYHDPVLVDLPIKHGDVL